MNRNLEIRKTTHLLMDSFGFLSRNFLKISLVFMLPVFLLLLSSLFLRTGFSFVSPGKHTPFTLQIKQTSGERLFLNNKAATMPKDKDGIRRIEGLPGDSGFTFRTERDLALPALQERAYLIQQDEISRATAALYKRITGETLKKGKTTLLYVKSPGWSLLFNNKPAPFMPTLNDRVAAVNLPDIAKTTITITHTKRIQTKKQSSGWIDGLQFTYGSPAIPIKNWVNIAFQIGTALTLFLLIAFLLAFFYSDYFTGTNPELSVVSRVFRSSGIRVVSTLLFLVIIQIPLMGILQGILFMMGSGAILLIPLLLLLSARIAPTIFIALMEGLQPWHALKRSFQLTKGASIRFFIALSGIMFLMIIYLNLAGILTAGVLGVDRVAVATNMTRMIGERLYIWPEASILFLSTIGILTIPLLPVLLHFLYSLYIDTRIRKEELEGKPAESLIMGQRK